MDVNWHAKCEQNLRWVVLKSAKSDWFDMESPDVILQLPFDDVYNS